MTQLSSAILALQTESVFASEYAKGTPKTKYWVRASASSEAAAAAATAQLLGGSSP